jgi:AraC family transcriptional regulator
MDPGDSRLISTRVQGDHHINQVSYPAGMRQGRHRHESASFSFVATGRYQERVGRQAHHRSAATLVYHPAGEHHAVAFETDVRILSIEFRGSRHAMKIDHGSSHRSALIAWLGARLERELVRVDSASTLAIDGIIGEMLYEETRGRVLLEEKATAKWLTRATDFVHDNFRSSMTLEEIAKVAGVHSAHLSRVFRQKMGCTVGEYVRRLRFEFASQQLLATERPLCEVAYEAGFADQSHFNRLFRRRMGLTPYTYRKLHRQG